MKRDKGLCYHCDEKWSPGHRCHPRIHLLIAADDANLPLSSEPLESPPPTSPLTPLEESSPLLSLNALPGMRAPETFRVYDTVHRHQLTILVDGGSTYNFVQLRVAKFLSLPLTPVTLLPVMVGDDGVIHCTRRYPQVTIDIQGHQFTTDLFGLPLSGADLVLGVQWLQGLGPITTDYTSLSMTFTHMGLPVHLIADVPITPPSASAHQLRHMLQTQAVAALLLLSPLLIPPPYSPTTIHHLMPYPISWPNSNTSSRSHLNYPLSAPFPTIYISPLTPNQS